MVDASGVQHILIEVGETSFSPARVRANGVPTRLTLRTDGIRGCTSTFVIPKAGVEQALPETGDTVIDLGAMSAGSLHYTCSTGMYGGVIETS
jgi:plastocyanin domain-containing protein